jgi:hypothetical protein
MSSVNNKIARQIFQKWKSELKDKNRSWGNIYSNFDDLAVEWYYAKLTLEDTHDIFTEAIRAHQPTVKVAKMAYAKSELKKFMSFDEFIKEWNEGIDDKAWQAYYSYYKATEAEEEIAKPTVVTGGMDRKEYAKQRRYAESFEMIEPGSIKHQFIDISELERSLDSITSKDTDGDTNSVDLENL